MPRNRSQRRADDRRAAETLAAHLDPCLDIVAQALDDVNPGQAKLAACVRDARLVLDIAKRMDEAIPTPEPVEQWDRLLWVLVASLALAIYRSSKLHADPGTRARKLVSRLLAGVGQRAQALGDLPPLTSPSRRA